MTRRRECDPLLTLTQTFFTEHLRRIRGASEHTIRAYRDGLRLFFLFLADHTGRPISELCLDDIRAEPVLEFLHHVESVRGNRAVTRNCRLATIRSFAAHLLRHDVSRAGEYGRILVIPSKRTSQGPVSYLEPKDARAIIDTIDEKSRAGRRDRALLLFLYNTGARVGEALAVRPRDLQLGRPRQVRLHGKGGKERICPLWPETAAKLRHLLAETAAPEEPIFRSARGATLTRDGVAYVIVKHVLRASGTRPSLRRRKVTPHVFRHSCAIGLLQAGNDVTVIRDYLGHASIATTNRYLASNLKMKREVLQAFWNRAGLDRQPASRWRATPKLLDFLTSL